MYKYVYIYGIFTYVFVISSPLLRNTIKCTALHVASDGVWRLAKLAKNEKLGEVDHMTSLVDARTKQKVSRRMYTARRLLIYY
jgi:hypothetical protein